jgi:two-component system, NtrC family, nitrogen regulation response regulator NtrX
MLSGIIASGVLNMNYLMYYIEGFIKKFPLDKPVLTIGRHSENNLVIREDSISRNHVQIKSHDDYITVKDLKSTNGINFRDEKVKEARIRIGESFVLGKMEFFLKRGSLDEFKLAPELIPIFDTISSANYKKFDNVITRYIEDIYAETLKVVMQAGLKKNDFKEFLLDLPNHLSNLTDLGSLFIISWQKNSESFDILLSVKNDLIDMEVLKSIVTKVPDLFEKQIISQVLEENLSGSKEEDEEEAGMRLFSYPLSNGESNTTLLFIQDRFRKKEKEKLVSFLSSLAVELDLLSQLLSTKVKPPAKGQIRRQSSEQVDIIAKSRQMKELIEQTKKIAPSDIFVLIQGESGTGKELFARLIHECSGRAKSKYVAINCAAIPENLLESELFGHEKGAFTGAYAQKKGKLELASGGTLVLDEIGDMPINLQAKLLRALQEKEFYRLGGATPIYVDLRIISITNRDLEQLIADCEFREDLFYRLVHRSILIPALRERKEDIEPLINFFTMKFCQQTNKKIKGYAIKASETLQAHAWKGNVRQLENEIRSIVNLTDDGETVSYDILSDRVKKNTMDDTLLKEISDRPGKMDPEMEKVYIIKLLEKNGWNKSKTAREMNMTYMGLHKKMKKMGLSKKEDG